MTRVLPAPGRVLGLGAAHAQATSRRSQGRPLFSCLVGELLDELKSGCRIANSIEEDLIRLRWPVGMIYGSEANLSECFQVGRAAIREAVRVLEVRGSARMRRGPNGGLQVLRPSRPQSIEMAADYLLLLGLESPQIEEAQHLLDQINASFAAERADAEELQQIKGTALPFFQELIDLIYRLQESNRSNLSGSKMRPLFHRSRAGQIARRLLNSYTPQQWVRGTRLGSAFELCERYGTNRRVLRQAIRILESAGMAISVSGRGHGLVSHAPQPASVCRLISCHFAAHGLSAGASMRLYHAISIEAVAKIAELATSADVARINSTLDLLERARQDHAGIDDVVFEVEESQFSILKNPLIDLFLRSTKAFPAWDISHSKIPSLLYEIHLTETRKVAAAIASKDCAGAAAAQDCKFQRLALAQQAG